MISSSNNLKGGAPRYRVKEIFPSLQGEGSKVGTPCLFVRFAGCNLWNGKESGRSDAVCKYCDTDFLGGDTFTHNELLAEVDRAWNAALAPPLIVLTGGEPLLQVTDKLVEELSYLAEVDIETNGTVPTPTADCHIVCSPKPGAPLHRKVVVDEYKVVYPQEGLQGPDELREFVLNLPGRFLKAPVYIQPNANVANAERAVLRFLKTNVNCRMSLQTHKILNLR